MIGQASLCQRVGVWSMHRFGDSSDPDAFTLALRRTLGTATHETMHIRSMPHCIEFVCCLNGSNQLKEADSRSLQTCAICERELSWKIKEGPLERFEQRTVFCLDNDMADEAEWFESAAETLRET